MEDVWFDSTGEGETLVLLHPGATDSRAMAALSDELGDYRRVAIDRPGHGRSPDVEGNWSFEAMADAVADAMTVGGACPAHLVGWSDGAIVGLYLALLRPELVTSLVFGGAVFHVSGWLDHIVDETPPAFLADAYGEVSPDGPEHWPDVVRKARDLHHRQPDLTVGQLRALEIPVLILAGDDDQMQWPHLLEMYEALPNAALAVVPRATHGLIVEKPALVADLIRDFHRSEGEAGIAPIRRAQPG